VRPYLKTKSKKAKGVSQAQVLPEFKPQYQKKKKIQQQE
jgi:hypothetical protein